MNPELAVIALTYVGMALGSLVAYTQRWPGGAIRACGRGAWCATWLFASLELAHRVALGGPCRVDPRGALTAGAWTFAIALCRHPLARCGVVLPALVIGLARGVPVALMMACGCLFGEMVGRAIQTGRWLTFRVLAYWLSFIGTFALLVPLMLPPPVGWDESVSRRLPLGLLLIAAACCLAVAGTRAFAQTGGTPEPLDPPRTLVTEGIYSHIQHPIQLAEILFVWAVIVLFPTTARLVYGLSFALFLIGPMRLWEESRLTARWGSAYHDYRRRVPLYFPHLRSWT